jgi:hypothetical protein
MRSGMPPTHPLYRMSGCRRFQWSRGPAEISQSQNADLKDHTHPAGIPTQSMSVGIAIRRLRSSRSRSARNILGRRASRAFQWLCVMLQLAETKTAGRLHLGPVSRTSSPARRQRRSPHVIHGRWRLEGGRDQRKRPHGFTSEPG